MGRVLVTKDAGMDGREEGYLSFFFSNSLTINGLYRSGLEIC